MKNLLNITLAGALGASLLFLTSCGGGGGKSGGGGSGFSTVKGRVIAAADGAPIQGATVTVGGKQATTGQTGDFSILQVSDSVTSGQVVATGYEDRFFELPAPINNVRDCGTIQMANSSGSDPPDLPYDISGIVILQGSPDNSGALVEAISGSSVVDSYLTPPDGSYYLFVPPGTYTVRASKSGYQPKEQIVVITDPNVRRENVNFTLSP